MTSKVPVARFVLVVFFGSGAEVCEYAMAARDRQRLAMTRADPFMPGIISAARGRLRPLYPPGMPFVLHSTLARDTVEVARLPLCRVLLMRDQRFPWLILVPEREAVREIHELPPEDRARLIEEVARVGETLERLFQPDKLNVGALGNIVPQLHIHIVARFADDPAWPGPVWGSGAAIPYTQGELEEMRERLASALGYAPSGGGIRHASRPRK